MWTKGNVIGDKRKMSWIYISAEIQTEVWDVLKFLENAHQGGTATGSWSPAFGYIYVSVCMHLCRLCLI